MSLIIKGMQLPRKSEHRECSIAVVQNRPVSIAFSRTKTNPFECFECAEISIPHGRLIDADKLLKSIDIMREQRCKTCSSRIDTKHCDRNGCWMIFISDFIGSLPTIIEAEVSE